MVTPLYRPSAEEVRGTNIERFRHLAGAADFDALYQWSIASREAFWSLLWDYGGVIGEKGHDIAINPDAMPGTNWFPQARLNFAENLLRSDDGPAVIATDERDEVTVTSRAELRATAGCFAEYLLQAGIKPGDRVAGVVPNRADTIAAMLGTTWIGGVWSSCSPDFGTQAIIDRFGQIEPRVLIGCTGYQYNGRWFDIREKLGAVATALPTVEQRVTLSGETLANWRPLEDVAASTSNREPAFARLPFAAPLYIMFSSGTTGVPKCIVHGIGGTLLQHLKEHQLHSDVRPGDHLFFFTTCGWMMWNWLASGLASGATLCLYDGSPVNPDPGVLGRFVEHAQINHFGISPGYIAGLAKSEYFPNAHHDLSSLRSILSTGSPLPAESFDWTFEHVAPVRLSSITGGTDIMGCFALGHPGLPVYRGEIQAPGLGMAADFFDDSGRRVRGEKGELVCTRSFPSMPTGFWNDPAGERYHAAYFERFPGVWHHGDFGEFTERGGLVIHGRSDAVLNRGGVRIGTAEIYRQVETLGEVLESIAIGQTWRDDVRIVLFVRLRDDAVLDETLRDRIRNVVRAGASPRHVPDIIVAVADIPRTRSGKLVELAVRDVVHGKPVKNLGALANPEALELFRNLPELKA